MFLARLTEWSVVKKPVSRLLYKGLLALFFSFNTYIKKTFVHVSFTYPRGALYTVSYRGIRSFIFLSWFADWLVAITKALVARLPTVRVFSKHSPLL